MSHCISYFVVVAAVAPCLLRPVRKEENWNMSAYQSVWWYWYRDSDICLQTYHSMWWTGDTVIVKFAGAEAVCLRVCGEMRMKHDPYALIMEILEIRIPRWPCNWGQSQTGEAISKFINVFLPQARPDG